ncbi:MAG: hypothetical protein V3R94_01680 [Acidobacteriota bacterium]
MSKELGPTLPQDLLNHLSNSASEEKSKEVILLNTVNENGWPRHGLLSHHEIIAKDPQRLLILLYSDSNSTRNVEREGKLSLVIINPNMSYFILCRARPLPCLPDAPSESLFELRVDQVLEDTIPTARILTGITFEGNDPGMTDESREQVYQQLVGLD